MNKDRSNKSRFNSERLDKHLVDGVIKLRVIPNSSREELKEDNLKLRLYLKAVPKKGKANSQLIKFFKKEFGLKVEIKSGMTGRNKILKVINDNKR